MNRDNGRGGSGRGDRDRGPWRNRAGGGGPRGNGGLRGRGGIGGRGGRAFGGRGAGGDRRRGEFPDRHGRPRKADPRGGAGRAAAGPSRREERRGRKPDLPPLPPGVSADQLDREVRAELRSLPLERAELVAKHLVAAGRALGEDDPERAYEHAQTARRMAPRIGVVREASGIAAYRAGRYAEALADLRAARRITGSDIYLPMIADCERGLGRPERALDVIRTGDPKRLDRASRIELAIVESGARRDLGQYEAAVITLQRVPELRDPEPRPWSARLAFAYADALADAGKEAAAVEWFARAMAFDEHGETDAAERYAELTGLVIEDIEEDLAEDAAGEPGEQGPEAEEPGGEPEPGDGAPHAGDGGEKATGGDGDEATGPGADGTAGEDGATAGGETNGGATAGGRGDTAAGDGGETACGDPGETAEGGCGADGTAGGAAGDARAEGVPVPAGRGGDRAAEAGGQAG
ncbi:hypothetical protein TBS_10310 [Thermobispora bispora]